MNKMLYMAIVCCLLFTACAKPLAEGTLTAMEPVSKEIPADPNSIYYATRWAMDQCGYPAGSENLVAGVIETKWVPVGAGSHYVDTVAGRDYGSNAAYYKMVIKIVPLASGKSRVEAQSMVKSIVVGMRSTGDKETEILDKISEYARGYDINVTNLGVEE